MLSFVKGLVMGGDDSAAPRENVPERDQAGMGDNGEAASGVAAASPAPASKSARGLSQEEVLKLRSKFYSKYGNRIKGEDVAQGNGKGYDSDSDSSVSSSDSGSSDSGSSDSSSSSSSSSENVQEGAKEPQGMSMELENNGFIQTSYAGSDRKRVMGFRDVSEHESATKRRNMGMAAPAPQTSASYFSTPAPPNGAFNRSQDIDSGAFATPSFGSAFAPGRADGGGDTSGGLNGLYFRNGMQPTTATDDSGLRAWSSQDASRSGGKIGSLSSSSARRPSQTLSSRRRSGKFKQTDVAQKILQTLGKMSTPLEEVRSRRAPMWSTPSLVTHSQSAKVFRLGQAPFDRQEDTPMPSSSLKAPTKVSGSAYEKPVSISSSRQPAALDDRDRISYKPLHVQQHTSKRSFESISVEKTGSLVQSREPSPAFGKGVSDASAAASSSPMDVSGFHSSPQHKRSRGEAAHEWNQASEERKRIFGAGKASAPSTLPISLAGSPETSTTAASFGNTAQRSEQNKQQTMPVMPSQKVNKKFFFSSPAVVAAPTDQGAIISSAVSMQSKFDFNNEIDLPLSSSSGPAKPVEQSSLFAKLAKLPDDMYKCSTCMGKMKKSVEKCISCEAPNPHFKETASSSSAQQGEKKPVQQSSLFAQLAKLPDDMYKCPACMGKMKKSVEKCISCEEPNPHYQATSPRSKKTVTWSDQKAPAAMDASKGDDSKPPPFSFGTSSSSSSTTSSGLTFPAATTTTTTTTTSEESKPTFSFGLKPEGESKGEPAKPPAFSFGAPAASDAGSSTSMSSSTPFSFGAQSSSEAKEEPVKSMFGTTEKASATPSVAAFSLPKLDAAKPESGKEEGAIKKAETPFAPSTGSGFPFGSSAPSSSSDATTSADDAAPSSSGTPSFSFGSTAASSSSPPTTTTTTPSFSFGASSDITKNASAEPPAKKKTFEFSSTSSNSSSFAFGAPSNAEKTESKPASGFQFGQQSSETNTAEQSAASNKGAFAFGAGTGADASKDASQDANPSATSSSSFVFGNASAAPKPAGQEQKSGGMFAFGSSSNKPETSPAPASSSSNAAPFQFGQPAASGGSEKPATSSPMFQFGASSGSGTQASPPNPTLEKKSPSFEFGSASGANNGGNAQGGGTGFSFGADSTSKTPTQSSGSTPFAFGSSSGGGSSSSNSGAPAPSFQFGSSSANPSSGGTPFGNASTSNGAFGNNAGGSTTNSFGAPAPNQPAGGAFQFGSAATNSNSNGGGNSASGMFGQPGGNAFGQPAANAPGGFGNNAPFGAAAANNNANKSPFGAQPTPFGNMNANPTPFGQQPQQQAPAPFGQSQPMGGFGQPPNAGAPTPFGQNPPQQPGAGGFGSFGSGPGMGGGNTGMGGGAGGFSLGGTGPVKRAGGRTHRSKLRPKRR